MNSKPLQSLNATLELPVEQLYNQAVADFSLAYGDLAKLPADPSDPLKPLDAMLRDMGVERDNDMSMFVMGAMGKIGSDAVSHAFGAAANNPLSVASDIAASVLSDDAFRPAPRNDARKTKSVFERPFKRAAAPKKGVARKFATSMLMAASAGRNALGHRHAASKRHMLKTRMEKARKEIELLAAFKSCGVKYARRATQKDKNGQTVSLLIPADNTQKLALTPERRQVDLKRDYKPMNAFKAPGLAA